MFPHWPGQEKTVRHVFPKYFNQFSQKAEAVLFMTFMFKFANVEKSIGNFFPTPTPLENKKTKQEKLIRRIR